MIRSTAPTLIVDDPVEEPGADVHELAGSSPAGWLRSPWMRVTAATAAATFLAAGLVGVASADDDHGKKSDGDHDKHLKNDHSNGKSHVAGSRADHSHKGGSGKRAEGVKTVMAADHERAHEAIALAGAQALGHKKHHGDDSTVRVAGVRHKHGSPSLTTTTVAGVRAQRVASPATTTGRVAGVQLQQPSPTTTTAPGQVAGVQVAPPGFAQMLGITPADAAKLTPQDLMALAKAAGIRIADVAGVQLAGDGEVPDVQQLAEDAEVAGAQIAGALPVTGEPLHLIPIGAILGALAGAGAYLLRPRR